MAADAGKSSTACAATAAAGDEAQLRDSAAASAMVDPEAPARESQSVAGRAASTTRGHCLVRAPAYQDRLLVGHRSFESLASDTERYDWLLQRFGVIRPPDSDVDVPVAFLGLLAVANDCRAPNRRAERFHSFLEASFGLSITEAWFDSAADALKQLHPGLLCKTDKRGGASTAAMPTSLGEIAQVASGRSPGNPLTVYSSVGSVLERSASVSEWRALLTSLLGKTDALANVPTMKRAMLALLASESRWVTNSACSALSFVDSGVRNVVAAAACVLLQALGVGTLHWFNLATSGKVGGPKAWWFLKTGLEAETWHTSGAALGLVALGVHVTSHFGQVLRSSVTQSAVEIRHVLPEAGPLREVQPWVCELLALPFGEELASRLRAVAEHAAINPADGAQRRGGPAAARLGSRSEQDRSRAPSRVRAASSSTGSAGALRQVQPRVQSKERVAIRDLHPVPRRGAFNSSPRTPAATHHVELRVAVARDSQPLQPFEERPRAPQPRRSPRLQAMATVARRGSLKSSAPLAVHQQQIASSLRLARERHMKLSPESRDAEANVCEPSSGDSDDAAPRLAGMGANNGTGRGLASRGATLALGVKRGAPGAVEIGSASAASLLEPGGGNVEEGGHEHRPLVDPAPAKRVRVTSVRARAPPAVPKTGGSPAASRSPSPEVESRVRFAGNLARCHDS